MSSPAASDRQRRKNPSPSPAPKARAQCLKYATAEINDMVFGHHHEPLGMTNAGPRPKSQPTSPTELRVHLQIIPLEIAPPTQQDTGPVSRTTAGREKLEGCPGESSNRENSSDLGRGVKRPRDALARYFSDANSFPDYGAPKHSEAMNAKDRLKRINSLPRHINTLGSHRSNADDGFVTPQPKRQRQTSHVDAHSDHFLASAKSPRQFRSRDSVVGGSQTDLYEIQSTSSAGNTLAALSSLQEYRKIQPMKRKKKLRTRVSRSNKSPAKRDLSALESDKEPSPFIASHSTGADALPPKLESPDDLSLLDPSPSRIISDVVQHRKPKRDRRSSLTDSPECQVKRKRPSATNDPIEVSEDELQGHSSMNMTTLNKKGDNAPNPRPGIMGDRRERLRGDISKTTFGNSTSKTISKRLSDKGLALVRAVSGKKTYRRNDECWLSLYQSSEVDTKFEPRNKTGEAMDEMNWLALDISQIQHARHSSSSRCYFLIHRPITQEAAAKLSLEFKDPKDAETLVEILRGYGVKTGKIDGVVEKTMEIAWDEAINYAASNAHFQEQVEQPLTDSLNGTCPVSESNVRKDSPKAEKLKDKLLRSSDNVDPQPGTARAQPAARHYDIETRSSSKLASGSAACRPNPESWTEKHPEWQKDWPRSLEFPATGKNRTTVDQEDILRLDEGEFLNDNLISFYLRYLQCNMEEERPELLNKVYIFNTFFFEKLRSTKGKINYEGVKAWTAKVDLLSYDYIVVPVNEHAHWYLAIICNAPNSVGDANEEMLPQGQSGEAPQILDDHSSPRISTRKGSMSDISLRDELLTRKKARDSAAQVTEVSSLPSSPTGKRKPAVTLSKNDLSQPKIITLDSLGSPHAPTCRALKDYLIQEAKCKRGIDLANPPTGMTARRIPEQDNFCDCGVFILGYMREFLKHPEEAASKLLQKLDVEWEINPTELRNQMRILLFDLQKKQRARLEVEKSQRRLSKQMKVVKETQQNSPTTSPAISHPSLTSSMPGGYPSSSPERHPEGGKNRSKSMEPNLDNLRGRDETGQDVVKERQQVLGEAQRLRYLGTTLTDSGSSPDMNEEPYFSASTSPKPEPPRSKIVVELKALKANQASRKIEDSTPVTLEDGTEPPVVHELSSSGSEGRPAPPPGKKGRKFSIEFIEARKARPGSSSKGRRHDDDGDDWEHKSPYFRPIQSIEADDVDELQEKPKYDGIARSVDLTIL